MNVLPGFRVFIPRQSFWHFNGVHFQAGGSWFYEFEPVAGKGSDLDVLTLNEQEIAQLAAPPTLH